jgi:hypothetical protein
MDSSTIHLYYLILFAEVKETFVTLKVDSFDSSSNSISSVAL